MCNRPSRTYYKFPHHRKATDNTDSLFFVFFVFDKGHNFKFTNNLSTPSLKSAHAKSTHAFEDMKFKKIDRMPG